MQQSRGGGQAMILLIAGESDDNEEELLALDVRGRVRVCDVVEAVEGEWEKEHGLSDFEAIFFILEAFDRRMEEDSPEGPDKVICLVSRPVFVRKAESEETLQIA